MGLEMESSYKLIEFSGSDEAFEQYKALVLATWLRGLKYGSDFFEMVDNEAYFTVYSKVILNLLKRPSTRVKLAVLSDEPDTVVGWSVFDGKVVHFVFVRTKARKQGIAKSLVPQEIDVVTHVTRIGKSIMKKNLSKTKFNPF